MKISILIGSRNRINALERCLKSVMLQDYSDIEVLVLDDSDNQNEYKKLFRTIKDPRFQLFHSPRPLGVSGSRNSLMEKAKGDIYFFIDDDAYFDEKDSLTITLESFLAQPRVGILAFKIQNHGESEREYNVPFNTGTLKRNPQLIGQSRFVAYFLGTAHAIRKDVIKECGLYNNALFFGEEELDLSYRAISHGWEIYYESNVLVHHMPQPSVIGKGNCMGEELFHHVKNRFYLAFSYLPARFIPLYLGIWTSKYLLDAIQIGAFKFYIKGIIKGLFWLRIIRRDALKPEAIEYLRENFGRLWY